MIWAALAISLAAPLAELASRALTEPLFILLAALALIRTDDYLTRNKTSSLAWAAAWAALAWQTRYLGAAVVVVVTLLLLGQRGARPAQRARRAAGSRWPRPRRWQRGWLRNRLAAGSYTGYRDGGPYSLPEVLSAIGRGFADWVYFDLPLVSVEWLRSYRPPGCLRAVGLVIGAQRRPAMPRMPRMPRMPFDGAPAACSAALR